MVADRGLETHDVRPPVASSWIKMIFLVPRSFTLNICFSLEVSETFRNAKIFLGESPLASCHQQGGRPSYIPYSVQDVFAFILHAKP